MENKTIILLVGILCHINVSLCLSLVYECATPKCFNNGICYSSNGGSHVCICQEGWAGEDCSIDVDECVSKTSQCPSDAICVNTQGGYSCDCTHSNNKENCRNAASVISDKRKRFLKNFLTPPPPMTTVKQTTLSPPPFTTLAPPTPAGFKTPAPITEHPMATGTMTTLAPPSIAAPVG